MRHAHRTSQVNYVAAVLAIALAVAIGLLMLHQAHCAGAQKACPVCKAGPFVGLAISATLTLVLTVAYRRNRSTRAVMAGTVIELGVPRAPPSLQ